MGLLVREQSKRFVSLSEVPQGARQGVVALEVPEGASHGGMVLEALSVLSGGAGWWHAPWPGDRLSHFPAREPVVN